MTTLDASIESYMNDVDNRMHLQYESTLAHLLASSTTTPKNSGTEKTSSGTWIATTGISTLLITAGALWFSAGSQTNNDAIPSERTAVVKSPTHEWHQDHTPSQHPSAVQPHIARNTGGTIETKATNPTTAPIIAHALAMAQAALSSSDYDGAVRAYIQGARLCLLNTDTVNARQLYSHAASLSEHELDTATRTQLHMVANLLK